MDEEGNVTLPEVIAWVKSKSSMGAPLNNTSKLIAMLESLLPKPKARRTGRRPVVKAAPKKSPKKSAKKK